MTSFGTYTINLSLTLCLLILPQTSYTQLVEQLGADIDGVAIGDWSGWSVSLSSDGNRLAIGAILNDDNGINAGHIRMYKWNDTVWVQMGSAIGGEAGNDLSGHSVSLSADGSRVAIGAYRNRGNGTDAGHVRIYDWNDTSWIQVGADIDGAAADCWAGYSVSLAADGNRVSIGEPHNDTNGRNAGRTQVYDWNGTMWTQVGGNINGEAELNGSGNSVSLSSDGFRVAIGANGNDDNGNDAGHVRVYEWNGNTWVQLGADIDGEDSGDNSGFSVSLSSNGNRVAIGALNNDGNGPDAGHVRVYDWDGTAWVQAGIDIDGVSTFDGFGFSVSLSEDGMRVAIGARHNSGGADQVRIFDWNGNAWIQTGGDIDREAAADEFGYSVSLSSDGQRVAIGAPLNDGNGADAGHVRVFELPQMSTAIHPGLSVYHTFDNLVPNPATNTTRFIFSLKSPGQVFVRVYNELGQLISDKIQYGSQGTNLVDWDVSQLPRGIYQIALTHKGVVQTRKLMIIRE